MEKSNMLARSAMGQTLLILGFLVVLGIGTAIFLTRRITRPIKELRKATTAFSCGAFDYPLTVSSNDEIGILTAAFVRMVGRLKEADRLKENFISNITHELKTPLTSLTEAARLILEKVAGPVTEKQAKLLVIIEKDAKRQLRLINDLLELSRMRAGMLTLQMEAWDLPVLAREAMESLNLVAIRKGVQLKLELRCAPVPFLMDGNRIYQVLTNLISNALKFTWSGGQVTVHIQERSIDEIQVSVMDTGVGISKDDQQRIFDRFYQLETQIPGKIEGSGLGLSIVRHIIKAHGGGIWVESEPQLGSTFFFVLPIRRTMKMGSERSLTDNGKGAPATCSSPAG
jgi:signal transduction histidine kinase